MWLSNMASTMQLIHDGWLSEIFKFDVFQLSINEPSDVKALDQHLRDELQKKPVFIYTKIPVDDIACVHLLENEAFNLIDTNINFERLIGKNEAISDNMTVRFADAEDEPYVRSIAGNSIICSRFHLDPKITDEMAKSLKKEWAGNYFHGRRGDKMVVSEREGRIAGFLQLIFHGDMLVIDLIAVSSKFRRSKIASSMIAYAETNLEGFNRIRVGTQIANLPSLRFYEKLGFHIMNASYVFHYHNK